VEWSAGSIPAAAIRTREKRTGRTPRGGLKEVMRELLDESERRAPAEERPDKVDHEAEILALVDVVQERFRELFARRVESEDSCDAQIAKNWNIPMFMRLNAQTHVLTRFTGLDTKHSGKKNI
jgi:hypothetical protein